MFVLSLSKTRLLQSVRDAHQQMSCGSRSNPWIVEAETGQHITVSLVDFRGHGGQSQSQRAVDVGPDTTCAIQYGYIVDKTATLDKKNTTICVGDVGQDRNRFVYQSKGSSIEIVLSTRHNNQTKFLVGLQGLHN